MGKVYNPVIIMKAGPDYVCFHGTLSALFEDWEKGGTNCLEQTGDGKREVREHLKKTGTYRIAGFVGAYFDVTVQES